MIIKPSEEAGRLSQEIAQACVDHYENGLGLDSRTGGNPTRINLLDYFFPDINSVINILVSSNGRHTIDMDTINDRTKKIGMLIEFEQKKKTDNHASYDTQLERPKRKIVSEARVYDGCI